MKSASCLALCSLLLFAACSAAAPEVASPEGVEAADEGPPENETERERIIRLAKEKRAQCDTVADTIEAEPEIDVIANINDSKALENVAGRLDKSRQGLEAVSVSDAKLAELYKAYVDILQGKAEALQSMAAAKEDAEKKTHLKTFQTHNDAVSGTLDGINEACSSAPGIVSEGSEEPSSEPPGAK